METDLTRVLSEDGIGKIDIHGSLKNVVHRLPEIKRKMGEPPWSVRIVYNDYISAVLIAQKPGQGNRWHYHDDCDEFWVVLEGALKWVIEEYGEIVAGKMDIVCVPRNMKHKMITVGDVPSIRLSISLPDVKHFFVEEGAK
jgi:mannose-6-phosphate isomerase-like protein (cupin superfamily)